MNKLLSLPGFALVLILLGCSGDSQKWPSVELQPSTPAYELAGHFAQKLDYFDPELNNVLASCSVFDIKTGDLVTHMQLNLYQYLDLYRSADVSVLEPQLHRVINNLAENRLMLNEAQKAEIEVSTTAVDSIHQRNYKNSNGKARYLQILKSIGSDEEKATAEVVRELQVRQYLKEILYKQITVSESEIIRFYTRDKTATVRHILLSTRDKNETDKLQIRDEIDKILKQARTGADFGELAKQHSQDPGSAGSGGLIANFGRGAMVPPFEDAAFSLQPGEISDIVETQYGYHIIKVIERKKEPRPLSEVREQIIQQVREQKQRDTYKTKIAQLKSETGYILIDFSKES